MLPRLLFLFLAIPIVEMILLIEIGRRIGLLATLGVVVLTGIIGAMLARAEGLEVFRRIQSDLAEGRLPGDAILDGVFVLAGGLLLLTPGLLTDLVGFLVLVPFTRAPIRRVVLRKLQSLVDTRAIHTNFRVEE